jgi:hypothetical protein
MDTYWLETSVDKPSGTDILRIIYFARNGILEYVHYLTLKSNRGYDCFRGYDGRISKIQVLHDQPWYFEIRIILHTRSRCGAQYSMSVTEMVEKSEI